jgi:hypothetical protein
MVGDFMPALEYQLDRARISLDAPRRNEERLPQIQTAEGIDKARHADFRPIPKHARERHTVRGRFALVDMQQAFAIHIEREGNRTPCAIGPRYWVLDHLGGPLEKIGYAIVLDAGGRKPPPVGC